jgi:hypothetical protein
VPGVVLNVKFTVSTIGQDEVIDNAFETDTVISDATMDTLAFDDVDLHEKESASVSTASSNSIMEKYNEERLQVYELLAYLYQYVFVIDSMRQGFDTLCK